MLINLISNKLNQPSNQTIGFVQIERYTTHVLEQESNRKEEDVCHLSPEEFTFAKEWVLLTCWKTLLCTTALTLFFLVSNSFKGFAHNFWFNKSGTKNIKINNYWTNIQSWIAYEYIVYFGTYQRVFHHIKIALKSFFVTCNCMLTIWL